MGDRYKLSSLQFPFSVKISLVIGLFLLSGKVLMAFTPPGDGQSVQFIPNEGQWNDTVEFKAQIPGGQFFITSNALVYKFWDQKKLSRYHHKKIEPGPLQMHVLSMELGGSSGASSTSKQNPSSTTYNFYQGSSPEDWAGGLKAYEQVTLKDVYPGIDMVIKGKSSGIKYDFIIQQEADPSRIELRWQGADSLFVNNGKLRLTTTLAPLIEENPVAYAKVGRKGEKTVPCDFDLKQHKVSFDFPEGYPDNKPLVIDPNVIFATFSGSQADNFGFTGTFDSAGHAYSAGTVYGSGFPTKVGGYETKFQGGKDVSREIGDVARDIGVLKYSEDGSQLKYATYLGGSHNEQPHSMIVNENNELIIYGTTFSWDFPVTSGTYDQNKNGNGADMYLAKLSPDGQQLRAATYIGGSDDDGLNGEYKGGIEGYKNESPLGYNYGDVYRGEVITDSQNHIYVASCTRSSDFPTTNGAFNQNYQGGYQDGCVFKMSGNLRALGYSTFIGGKSDDAAYSLKLDKSRNPYVVGGTESQNFKGLNDYQSNLKNFKADGYILKLGNRGEKALAGTYFGTSKFEQIYFVDMDGDGDVYVTGQSEGNMPVKNVGVKNPNSGQFISKFNPSLNTLIYSTVFGDGKGHPDIAPSAFLVDVCENVYVSGWGGRTNRSSRSEGTSTEGLPITNNAYQKQTEGSDFYLTVFKKGMDSLLYASFFGGPKSDEHVDGGTSRFDERGMVYQSVCGGCHGNSDFPVNDSAWSQTNNSRRGCNNAFFKIKLDVANAPPKVVNNAPETDDIVIEARASDTIYHPLRIQDPNEGDSIYLEAEGKIFDTSEMEGPVPTIATTKGVKNFNGQFYWPTICDYADQDTFTVNLNISDKGCPNPKSSTAELKIVLKDPPVQEPPEIFCSKVLDSNTLELKWDSFESSRYFSHFLLFRKNPDGSEMILDSIGSMDNRTYVDDNVPGLTKQEYCYYLRAVNNCGEKGPISYKICTGPDNQRAPHKRSVKTATVINDKHVKVKWEKATEPDFDRYIIYRKPNEPEAKFELYQKIEEQETTSFVDKDVRVDEQSYCYQVRVKDVCGFYSTVSNKGCTIVIEGESEPFEHSLQWNAYEKWNVGVNHYTVYRRDPLYDTNFRPIAEVNGQQLNYLDDSLNHDVGAYWYKVKANRGPGKGTGEDDITSQSNEIYLVQEPLLHVPNAFTINQDGLNEKWGVTPVFVKTIHIQVYNRWGALIFETQDKHEEWTGPEKHSYEEKFDNVFIYKITYTGWDGSFHSTQGDITILK